MMEIEEKIFGYALANALKFNGKANPGTVIGHLMRDDISVKDRLKEINPIIQKIMEKVNSMNIDEQRQLAEEKYSWALEEKKHEKREGLKDLPDANGKVVMRFAPSPSGPLHIGHSYVLSLNYEYVKKYGGELFLRIEDTNPENIDPIAYTQIPLDANWLCEGKIKKENILIQSERLELYYKHAKTLIEKNAAYICTCDPDKFKELLAKSEPCPCRNLSVSDSLKRYEMLFTDYKQGEAVMRFKSDITHKNPAMRDFPLMRINESEHPRTGTKYRVWPLMNFSVSVDDLETGVTHTLRAKDHADNALRQEMIHAILGFKTPNAISVGRINFEGFDLSTSKTRQKIREGIYDGWDDIRLPFLLALKRRGYKSGALRKFAVSVGVTKTDKTVAINEFFKTINSFNKEILESESDRYFFVKEPVKIHVVNAPSLDISMPFHSAHLKRGNRSFKTNTDFYIARQDHDKIPENKIFRLMDCINVVKKDGRFYFDSIEYEKYKELGCCMIIHWLPADETQIVKAKVLLPDKETREGFAEKTVLDLRIGDELQFERFGFVRFDSKAEDELLFWYTHN